MEAWCTEHPWMTFFIISGVLNMVVLTVREIRRPRKG